MRFTGFHRNGGVAEARFTRLGPDGEERGNADYRAADGLLQTMVLDAGLLPETHGAPGDRGLVIRRLSGLER